MFSKVLQRGIIRGTASINKMIQKRISIFIFDVYLNCVDEYANVLTDFIFVSSAFSTKKDAPVANTTAAKPAGKVSGSVS